MSRRRYGYHIELETERGWVSCHGTVEGLAYLQGWLAHHREAPGPRLAARLVRSDGRVMEDVPAQPEATVGMVAGWPTWQQYLHAAVRALRRAAAERAMPRAARHQRDAGLLDALLQAVEKQQAKTRYTHERR